MAVKNRNRSHSVAGRDNPKDFAASRYDGSKAGATRVNWITVAPEFRRTRSIQSFVENNGAWARARTTCALQLSNGNGVEIECIALAGESLS
jgi:hypothetical protein